MCHHQMHLHTMELRTLMRTMCFWYTTLEPGAALPKCRSLQTQLLVGFSHIKTSPTRSYQPLKFEIAVFVRAPDFLYHSARTCLISIVHLRSNFSLSQLRKGIAVCQSSSWGSCLLYTSSAGDIIWESDLSITPSWAQSFCCQAVHPGLQPLLPQSWLPLQQALPL